MERGSESARGEVARSTVAVVLGGRSSEREISLASGRSVLEALNSRASDGANREAPARSIAVEIEPSGAWNVGGERCSPASAIETLPADAIYLLALHGGEGENGAVQGFLETCSRTYTGSGVVASALCMDKHATRLLLAAAGFAVAPARLVSMGEWTARRNDVLGELRAISANGFVVKPNCGGSSVATSLVGAPRELPAAIETALATGDRALVERAVVGVEATCAVLGNAGGPLRALTPVEIVPKAGRFFDWAEKYSADGAEELCPPRGITAEVCERLRELSVRAHEVAGCDGYSRTDFIVPAEGGDPVVLEINTLPGLTGRSLLPKAAAAEGWSFRTLCLEILALAVERRRTRVREAAA